MLCGQCEDLFSEKETYFANQLFYSYLKKEKIVLCLMRRAEIFINLLQDIAQTGYHYDNISIVKERG